jgi:hypothetical protein
MSFGYEITKNTEIQQMLNILWSNKDNTIKLIYGLSVIVRCCSCIMHSFKDNTEKWFMARS